MAPHHLIEPKTAVYPVSEYGEFYHLLNVAKEVQTALGLHPLFVFRHDYGAIKRHSQIAEGKGYSWAVEDNARDAVDNRLEATGDGYFKQSPSARPLLRGGRKGGSRREEPRGMRRKASLLLLRLLQVLYALQLLLAPLLLPYLLYRLARRTSLGKRVKSFVRRRSTAKNLAGRLRSMRALFDHFEPVLVISGQDYVLSVTSLAAKVADDRGIRTLIIPFSMTPTVKEIAESFAMLEINVVRMRMTLWLMSKVWPEWLNRYRGQNYTRLPLLDVIAATAAGVAPPEPWVPNSGRGIILAPSAQSADYCRSAGIPDEQVEVTGALWNDHFLGQAASRRRRRRSLLNSARNYYRHTALKHGIQAFAGRSPDDHDDDPSDILIIVSFPPNQWPRAADGFNDFATFAAATGRVLASLVSGGHAQVVISLHPTLHGSPVAHALSEEGLYVTNAQLRDILDCADIFTATVSSTLLWAVQLGVPSINFDPYSYGYSEFREAGMLEASTLPDLYETLLDLTSDRTELEALRARIMKQRDYWTCHDGHSKQRILEAVAAHAKVDATAAPLHAANT